MPGVAPDLVPSAEPRPSIRSVSHLSPAEASGRISKVHVHRASQTPTSRSPSQLSHPPQPPKYRRRVPSAAAKAKPNSSTEAADSIHKTGTQNVDRLNIPHIDTSDSWLNHDDLLVLLRLRAHVCCAFARRSIPCARAMACTPTSRSACVLRKALPRSVVQRSPCFNFARASVTAHSLHLGPGRCLAAVHRELAVSPRLACSHWLASTTSQR